MPFNPTNQLHSLHSVNAVGPPTSCCCKCARASSSTSRRSPDLRGGTMMASGPAAGRSASTQRSTVAGDAKPIVTMIECEAGHTRPDARAARATNSADQQCPTARAVTSPGQSRIEAITPLGDKPIGAEPDTHMAHREVRIPTTQSPENATGQTPRLTPTCGCDSRRAASPPSVRSWWPMPSVRRGARLAHQTHPSGALE